MYFTIPLNSSGLISAYFIKDQLKFKRALKVDGMWV